MNTGLDNADRIVGYNKAIDELRVDQGTSIIAEEIKHNFAQDSFAAALALVEKNKKELADIHAAVAALQAKYEVKTDFSKVNITGLSADLEKQLLEFLQNTLQEKDPDARNSLFTKLAKEMGSDNESAALLASRAYAQLVEFKLTGPVATPAERHLEDIASNEQKRQIAQAAIETATKEKADLPADSSSIAKLSDLRAELLVQKQILAQLNEEKVALESKEPTSDIEFLKSTMSYILASDTPIIMGETWEQLNTMTQRMEAESANRVKEYHSKLLDLVGSINRAAAKKGRYSDIAADNDTLYALVEQVKGLMGGENAQSGNGATSQATGSTTVVIKPNPKDPTPQVTDVTNFAAEFRVAPPMRVEGKGQVNMGFFLEAGGHDGFDQEHIRTLLLQEKDFLRGLYFRDNREKPNNAIHATVMLFEREIDGVRYIMVPSVRACTEEFKDALTQDTEAAKKAVESIAAGIKAEIADMFIGMNPQPEYKIVLLNEDDALNVRLRSALAKTTDLNDRAILCDGKIVYKELTRSGEPEMVDRSREIAPVLFDKAGATVPTQELYLKILAAMSSIWPQSDQWKTLVKSSFDQAVHPKMYDVSGEIYCSSNTYAEEVLADIINFASTQMVKNIADGNSFTREHLKAILTSRRAAVTFLPAGLVDNKIEEIHFGMLSTVLDVDGKKIIAIPHIHTTKQVEDALVKDPTNKDYINARGGISALLGEIEKQLKAHPDSQAMVTVKKDSAFYDVLMRELSVSTTIDVLTTDKPYYEPHRKDASVQDLINRSDEVAVLHLALPGQEITHTDTDGTIAVMDAMVRKIWPKDVVNFWDQVGTTALKEVLDAAAEPVVVVEPTTTTPAPGNSNDQQPSFI